MAKMIKRANGTSAAAHDAPCGCATRDKMDGRTAVAVDPAVKERNTHRLHRIEGQVRGIARMVEDERYCADVITQVAAVQEALRSVARELMRNHLKHCATKAIRRGDDEAERMYDELVDLMFKGAR